MQLLTIEEFFYKPKRNEWNRKSKVMKILIIFLIILGFTNGTTVES